MQLLLDPSAWIAFITLSALEIVLGIDNIVFLSIVVGRLPPGQRPLARRLGLGAAMGTRILLLLSITWVMGLTTPLLSVLHHPIAGRDLILFCGGLFLIAKATMEVHNDLEGVEGGRPVRAAVSFFGAVAQIGIIDIVFSLDSVITAVGLARQLAVMIAAVVAAVFVMMWAAGPIGDFIDRHPAFKMLALSFLLLVGVALVGEALGLQIPKGYIYFTMAFSVGVELLNMRVRRRAAEPVHLRVPRVPEEESAAERSGR
jgi:predicted tellurium resistance membrane protein TerC